MHKRGQTTVFLIIGILVLVIFGIILFVRSEYFKSAFEAQQAGLKQTPQQAQPLVDYITYCTQTTANEGIAYIAERGWRYNSSQYSDKNQFPWFLYENRIVMPSQNDVANQLSLYINDNLPSCTKLLKSNAFTIKYGKPNSTTVITPSSIEVNVNYPVEFAKGNFSINLDTFHSTLNFNFNKVYNATSEFIQQQSKADSLCLSCMYNTGLKNLLYFQFYTVSNTEQEITIKDYKTLINNKPYTLTFAIKEKK